MQAVLSVVFLITGAIVVVGFAYLLAPRLVPARRSAIGFAVVAAIAFAVGFVVAPRAAPTSDPTEAGAAPASADMSATCAILKGKRVSKAGAGSLDSIVATSSAGPLVNGALLRPGDSIVLAGWAISADKSFLARAVCVEIDGGVETSDSAMYGIARPDVASALSDPTLERSGFEIRVAASALRNGAHTVAVAVIDADGSSGTLGVPRLIGVRP